MKITKVAAPESLSRTRNQERGTVVVAAIQMHFEKDPHQHQSLLAEAISAAAAEGAQVVFLPELTLSRYPADTLPVGTPNESAEDLLTGPTFRFAAEQALKHGVFVHASLYQKVEMADGRGLNTAIIVGPDGKLVGATDKLHIPVTEGYFEDKYFAAGENTDPYRVHELALTGTPKLGMPTCWDEWFPEVARAYGLAGADILCYPTAIGSEPDHPDFDTEPLWHQVIVGHAIANGLFIAVPNRWGNEGLVEFYGSSFIVDPYGRVLARAARHGDEVLIAEIDLDQRRDWLELFPFFATRRPDTYSSLSAPLSNPRGANGQGIAGGIPGIAQ
ncbi:MAG: nitrilase-related carbon-nitrogen hydrolase [Aquiluna sp.]|nr:nitrilase-related carbon-nitrogen hydrolase [Aquiluna sp.]